MNLDQRYFTVTELEPIFRRTRWGIYDLVSKGFLKAIRLGGKRMIFSEEAVQDALRRGEQLNEEKIAV
jgi:hypothetical protein